MNLAFVMHSWFFNAAISHFFKISAAKLFGLKKLTVKIKTVDTWIYLHFPTRNKCITAAVVHQLLTNFVVTLQKVDELQVISVSNCMQPGAVNTLQLLMSSENYVLYGAWCCQHLTVVNEFRKLCTVCIMHWATTEHVMSCKLQNVKKKKKSI